jgi:hypothetical protein
VRLTYCLQLFIWDDGAYSDKIYEVVHLLISAEIDAEVGRLAGDLKAAGKFRDDTLRYMTFCLGLSETPCPVPDNRIIAFFKVIGDAAQESYTLGEDL